MLTRAATAAATAADHPSSSRGRPPPTCELRRWIRSCCRCTQASAACERPGRVGDRRAVLGVGSNNWGARAATSSDPIAMRSMGHGRGCTAVASLQQLLGQPPSRGSKVCRLGWAPLQASDCGQRCARSASNLQPSPGACAAACWHARSPSALNHTGTPFSQCPSQPPLNLAHLTLSFTRVNLNSRKPYGSENALNEKARPRDIMCAARRGGGQMGGPAAAALRRLAEMAAAVKCGRDVTRFIEGG